MSVMVKIVTGISFELWELDQQNCESSICKKSASLYHLKILHSKDWIHDIMQLMLLSQIEFGSYALFGMDDDKSASTPAKNNWMSCNFTSLPVMADQHSIKGICKNWCAACNDIHSVHHRKVIFTVCISQQESDEYNAITR